MKYDSLPREGDGDCCPICLVPLVNGDCVRHDQAEMNAWGNKYRRDMETAQKLLFEARRLIIARLNRDTEAIRNEHRAFLTRLREQL